MLVVEEHGGWIACEALLAFVLEPKNLLAGVDLSLLVRQRHKISQVCHGRLLRVLWSVLKLRKSLSHEVLGVSLIPYRDSAMKPVKQVKLDCDLVAYASRDCMVIDICARIQSEVGAILVESHQSPEIVVDGNLDVHAAGDAALSTSVGWDSRRAGHLPENHSHPGRVEEVVVELVPGFLPCFVES